MNKIFKKLLKSPISFLDIGALGYTYKPLEKFSSLFWYHGFDPVFMHDKQQNIQLRNSKKKWKKYTIHPYALNDKKSHKVMFNIYNAETNNSFLRSNQSFVKRYNMQNKWSISKKIYIKTQTLNNIKNYSKDKNFGDVMKIDTQGTELKILMGSKNVIKNTKFIIAEAAFVHLYEKQNLFSELEIFLRKNGFSFYCFTDLFYRSKKYLNKLKYLGRERMIYSDAIFIKDPYDQKNISKFNQRDLVVIFISSLSFQLYDYALEILNDMDINDNTKIKIKNYVLSLAKKAFIKAKVDKINILDLEKKIKETKLFTNLNEYL